MRTLRGRFDETGEAAHRPGHGFGLRAERTIRFQAEFAGMLPLVENLAEAVESLENQELTPDILVYNDANARQAGTDPQLEAAVAELLKQLGKK